MTASTPLPLSNYAVRLRGLRVPCHVGVPSAERDRLQDLIVALDVEHPGELYPRLDDLEVATDYGALAQIVMASAKERSFVLLETFALLVAERVTARFPRAERVRVAVTKAVVPLEPKTEEATVEIVLCGSSS
ncbi:MAG: hypothetical protein B6A08_10515 [Sorangiineae bacterium NIC37A_2]|nr:MAG: hypothetical protein B6A08_10515 [Sorangiineae bacterium NIC37A_2]